MLKPGLTALFAVTLVETACDIPNRVRSLEKQTKELKEEMSRKETVGDFELQIKCSREAKEWFKEMFQSDKDTTFQTYQDHFNKKLTKCFIATEWHYSMTEKGEWMNHMELWDVYENRKYGEFSEHHQLDLNSTPASQSSVYSCMVANQRCAAIDDFQNLVRPYMSN